MSTKIYYCHYFFKISYIINTFIIIINKKHVKNSWISFVVNPTMWISLPRSKWDGLPPTYWMVALFIQLYSRITIRGTEKFNVNETENDMTQSAKKKKKKSLIHCCPYNKWYMLQICSPIISHSHIFLITISHLCVF